jgi:hypothetical protein
MCLSRRSESLKPPRKRDQFWGRPTSRRMEPGQYRADYATGFVVAAVAGKIGKGNAVFSSFHEKRINPVRQYTRRTLPVPPIHEQAAELLLVVDGYLEHGGHAAPPNRQKSARGSHDGVAVWR